MISINLPDELFRKIFEVMPQDMSVEAFVTDIMTEYLTTKPMSNENQYVDGKRMYNAVEVDEIVSCVHKYMRENSNFALTVKDVIERLGTQSDMIHPNCRKRIGNTFVRFLRANPIPELMVTKADSDHLTYCKR